MFGCLSRSKRSSSNIDEGGGHSGVVLSLVYFDSPMTVFIVVETLSFEVHRGLKKKYTDAQLEKCSSSKFCFQKEGGALKAILNNGCPKQTQLVSAKFIYCFSKRKQYFGVGKTNIGDCSCCNSRGKI